MKKTALAVFFVLELTVTKENALTFEGERTKTAIVADAAGIE